MWLDDAVKHAAWLVVCSFLAWGWFNQATNTRAMLEALGSTGYSLELCTRDLGQRVDEAEQRTEAFLEAYGKVLGRMDVEADR